MTQSLKKFWTKTPTTGMIIAALVAVSVVMFLISGGVLFWHIYIDVYTSMDGGFLAFGMAVTAAMACGPAAIIWFVVDSLLDHLDIV